MKLFSRLMSPLRTTLTGLLACAISAAAGAVYSWNSRPIYLVPQLPLEQRQTSAKVYTLRIAPENFVTEFNPEPLLSLMRQASWTNEPLVIKSASTILLGNGKVLCVASHGSVYWIKGVPGYYVIGKANQAAFVSAFAKYVTLPGTERAGVRWAEGPQLPRGDSEERECTNSVT